MILMPVLLKLKLTTYIKLGRLNFDIKELKQMKRSYKQACLHYFCFPFTNHSMHLLFLSKYKLFSEMADSIAKKGLKNEKQWYSESTDNISFICNSTYR